MKPEELARQNIDQFLEMAGWKVQDYKDFDLSASHAVGVGIMVFYSLFGYFAHLQWGQVRTGQEGDSTT